MRRIDDGEVLHVKGGDVVHQALLLSVGGGTRGGEGPFGVQVFVLQVHEQQSGAARRFGHGVQRGRTRPCLPSQKTRTGLTTAPDVESANAVLMSAKS